MSPLTIQLRGLRKEHQTLGSSGPAARETGGKGMGPCRMGTPCPLHLCYCRQSTERKFPGSPGNPERTSVAL